MVLPEVVQVGVVLIFCCERDGIDVEKECSCRAHNAGLESGYQMVTPRIIRGHAREDRDRHLCMRWCRSLEVGLSGFEDSTFEEGKSTFVVGFEQLLALCQLQGVVLGEFDVMHEIIE